MRPGLREKFVGLYAGLAVVLAAGIFFFVLKVGGDAIHQAAVKPDPLSSWSIARIMAELGEYDTKVPDCAGLVEGMDGYAYARFNTVTGQVKGIVIVCR